MKKSELLKLLEGIDDEGSVDEVLSKSDFAKSLIDGGLTLDAFKEKIANDKSFKSFMDSENDKYHSKALETWKSNNLQTIINDEVLKATGKKKTPEQIQIEELQKKFEAQEKENTRLKNESTVKSMLSEAGFDPSKTLEFFNIDDMENMETRIGNFKALIDEKTQAGIKDAIASGSYTPPGENGSGELSVDDLAKMMM